MRRPAAALAALCLATAPGCGADAATVFHVTLGAGLGPALGAPAPGRLLVFAQPLAEAQADAKGAPLTEIDAGEFHPRAVAVAAQEVDGLSPGATVDLDADADAFPQAFSRLKPGRYAVQAVLDRDHSYAYGGRGPGDVVSPVVTLDLPAGGALSLGEVKSAARDPRTLPADAPAEAKAQYAAAAPDIHPLDVQSGALTKFWGRPVHMRGWVVTPPGYAQHPDQRYPTVYWTHGFGGTIDNIYRPAVLTHAAMAAGQTPPMIWVFLDEATPTGTHEFADSVNNGPWGLALTTELIPAVEHAYRMDGRASGRFLNGHSSGGWATLWMQTRYPKVFGGTWSTSPDPSDFHDFTGVDLYAPGANMYRRAGGEPYPIMRDKGHVEANLEDFARLEAVLGPYGGQMSSFDWVFSPRGQGGRPQPMFDRATGAVDPQVVEYWRDHYDIAHRLQTDWPALKPDLDGKIHLIVGTADTFYLDGAAHRLQAVLNGLGAHSDFRFLPGRTHFDLYTVGADRQGLLKQIAWEMYAVARPGAKRPGGAAAAVSPSAGRAPNS